MATSRCSLYGRSVPTSFELFQRRQAQSSERRKEVGLQHVPHSYTADGFVRFGDAVLLQHLSSKTTLSCDVWSLAQSQPQPTNNEGCSGLVFAEEKSNPGRLLANARSSFAIHQLRHVPEQGRRKMRPGLDREENKFVHFMEDFQIRCNPALSYDRELDIMQAPFLLSCTMDRATNTHVVGLTRDAEDTSTYFKFVHISPLPTHRSQTVRVSSTEPVCIQHTMTGLLLVPHNRVDFKLETALQLSHPGYTVACKRKGHPVEAGDVSWSIVYSTNPEDARELRGFPERVTDGNKLLEWMRKRVKERSPLFGIRELSRVFRQLDNDRSSYLSREEVGLGLQRFGIHLDTLQRKNLFERFDRNGDGRVSVSEFLIALRGPLSQRRLTLIAKAFSVLDRDNSGEITLEEMCRVYDSSFLPEVIDGSKTHETAVREFMSQWETNGEGKADGVVSLAEFINFYKDVSASIDSDDYFELMMRNAWHISGGKDAYENTANIRCRVTHTDGSSEIVELVDDFAISRNELPLIRAKLRAQGVTDIRSISLSD